VARPGSVSLSAAGYSNRWLDTRTGPAGPLRADQASSSAAPATWTPAYAGLGEACGTIGPPWSRWTPGACPRSNIRTKRRLCIELVRVQSTRSTVDLPAVVGPTDGAAEPPPTVLTCRPAGSRGLPPMKAPADRYRVPRGWYRASGRSATNAAPARSAALPTAVVHVCGGYPVLEVVRLSLGWKPWPVRRRSYESLDGVHRRSVGEAPGVP